LYIFLSIEITLFKGLPLLFSYKEYKRFPSPSIKTNLVVVDPASIPTKQFPENVFKSFSGTVVLSCLSLNSL
jgi:hypothetical protein